VGNGADDSQHGQAWREVRTLALRATTPRKGVFAFGNPTHLITLHCIIMYNTVYIYPLQVKNKPREGIAKPVFILGPVSVVANRDYI
jgi:hypothetical protein